MKKYDLHLEIRFLSEEQYETEKKDEYLKAASVYGAILALFIFMTFIGTVYDAMSERLDHPYSGAPGVGTGKVLTALGATPYTAVSRSKVYSESTHPYTEYSQNAQKSIYTGPF